VQAAAERQVEEEAEEGGAEHERVRAQRRELLHGGSVGLAGGSSAVGTGRECCSDPRFYNCDELFHPGASSFSIPLYWLCYTYRSVCTKERKKKGAWPHREPNRWALSRSDGLMFSGGRGSCRRVTARQLALPERQQQHANPLPTPLQLGEADVRMSPSQFGEA
jgi:hypothetical protein